METKEKKIRNAKKELAYCNHWIKLYWEMPLGYISEERIKDIVEREHKAKQQLKELEDGNGNKGKD